MDSRITERGREFFSEEEEEDHVLKAKKEKKDEENDAFYFFERRRRRRAIAIAVLKMKGLFIDEIRKTKKFSSITDEEGKDLER